MKKLTDFLLVIVILIAMLFALGPQPAHAGIKDYRVGLPLSLNYQLVGARDLRYGEWLTGQSVDVLWLRRKDEKVPIFYFALNHLFNFDRAGKGAFGGALGVNTGKMSQHLEKAANLLIPGQAKRLAWLGKASNWISIEGGGGYKLYGVPAGQNNWYYTIGDSDVD